MLSDCSIQEQVPVQQHIICAEQIVVGPTLLAYNIQEMSCVQQQRLTFSVCFPFPGLDGLQWVSSQGREVGIASLLQCSPCLFRVGSALGSEAYSSLRCNLF